MNKLKKFTQSITGISCPIFGISWNPPINQQKIARDIINFLAAKRVLYNPYEYEIVDHCISSVIDIRNYLTTKLSDIDAEEKLIGYVRGMQNACNRFLNQNFNSHDFREYVDRPGNINNWMFLTSLGELRGIFGIMIGQISSVYNVPLDDNLITIVPFDMLDND